MTQLTIHDRTSALVSDKRAHVERLRAAVARLQAELFGAFPEPVEKEAPEAPHANTVEGDLLWLMELNQDTRNALDVLDSIISNVTATAAETRGNAPVEGRIGGPTSARETYPPAVARR